MASLQNAQIDQSYQGLIKTSDNTSTIPFPPQMLQFGDGTTFPIQIADLSAFGAGTQIALKSGTSEIAVDTSGFVITNGGTIDANAGTVLFKDGTYNFGDAGSTTSVDFTNATVTGLPTATAGLEIGTGTNALQNAIGSASTASGAQSIALGAGALASGPQSMAYGDQAQATSTSAASFGQYAEATSTYAIAFGRTSTATADGAVAFGQQTSAAQAGAVAMGRQVQSDTADTTHVRALKIVAPDGGTGGNGITMLSPNGTAGVITLTNTSDLAIDGTVIGGAAGLENGTGTDSLQSAAALTTTAADASGNYSIALGDGASATRQESVAIGQNAAANGSGSDGSIAIGNGAVASNNRSVVIGVNNSSSSSEGVAIGDDVDIAGSDRSIGIGGNITLSGGSDKVAIGTSSSVTGTRGLAFGQNASATASEAIAIGYNITAATAQTLTINLLQIAGYAGMNYADDTAAAAGGIPLGGVYHTSGALKIRIV